MALRDTEKPVKPLTPLVRLKKGLGWFILYSEHSLQFQAWIPSTPSYAIADIYAISLAMAGEYAEFICMVRHSRSIAAGRKIFLDIRLDCIILNDIYYYSKYLFLLDKMIISK